MIHTNKATPVDITMIDRVLEEARMALQQGKVGIGALLTYNDEIIALGHNMYEETHDITAHAEMVVLRMAAQRIDALSEEEKHHLILYSTLQPCMMCFAAISFAGIKRVVFSALNEDGEEDIQITHGISTEEINKALVRGPIELIGGVKREEGKALLARMGRLKGQ